MLAASRAAPDESRQVCRPHIQKDGQTDGRQTVTLRLRFSLYAVNLIIYKNSSGDEIANVNFFYDELAHILQNTEKKTYFV